MRIINKLKRLFKQSVKHKQSETASCRIRNMTTYNNGFVVQFEDGLKLECINNDDGTMDVIDSRNNKRTIDPNVLYKEVLNS